MDLINLVQPTLGEAELAAVREVFASNWVGRGPRTSAFEGAFAQHLGVDPGQVTAMSSCTSATFVAVDLLGVGPGDEVVLPTVSFVGVGNAIRARGATPVFCDVDPRTLNPRAEHIEAVLNPRTAAVVILHYGGAPGEVVEIARLCAQRGVPLLEDAALAVASSVDGQACGTFGDLAVWSFDHAKVMVTVDGGMLWARDPALAECAEQLAYLGLTQPGAGMSGSSSFHSGFVHAGDGGSRWWDYDVVAYTTRSTTNDVLSAIGLVQLERLGGSVSRRAEVAHAYDALLQGVPGVVTPPALPAGHVTSHFAYWVQFDDGIRNAVARALLDRGIYTTFRYPLMHRIPAYGSQARLGAAEHAAEHTLLMPIHQSLSDADVDRVVAELVEVTRRLRSRAA